MIKKKVFTVNNSDEKLVGLKTKSNLKKKNYKTVILVHGFGVDKENNGLFTDLSSSLVDVGFLVYRFDFSGCGESDGNYAQTSITKLTSDLEKIIEFVKNDDEVDSNNIAIIGNCTGAVITYNSNIQMKSTILINAHYDIYSVIVKLFKDNLNTGGISCRTTSKGKKLILNSEFWNDLNLNHKNIIDKIKNLNSPTLYISSGDSKLVSLEQVKNLYQLTNVKKTMVEITGADHNFTNHRQELFKTIITWLNNYLN